MINNQDPNQSKQSQQSNPLNIVAKFGNSTSETIRDLLESEISCYEISNNSDGTVGNQTANIFELAAFDDSYCAKLVPHKDNIRDKIAKINFKNKEHKCKWPKRRRDIRKK